MDQKYTFFFFFNKGRQSPLFTVQLNIRRLKVMILIFMRGSSSTQSTELDLLNHLKRVGGGGLLLTDGQNEAKVCDFKQPVNTS